VSDAPSHDHADEVPSVEELQRTAIPAAIRHAPRLGRFIGTGIGFGTVLGIVLGAVLPNSTGAGRGIVMVLLGAGFALIGGLIAGVIATRVDKPLPNAVEWPLFPQDRLAPDAVDDFPPTDRSNGETT